MNEKKESRLTFIEKIDSKYSLYKCKCGNVKKINKYNVNNGKVKSCGCLFAEGNNTKHGDRYTRLYGIWKGMRCRCLTKSSSAYKRYGAQGVCICEEWNDYSKFKEWAMQTGYSDELTLDRVDYNGSYEPANCRWVTYKEQANNTRANRRITINGCEKTMSEWSNVSGIKTATIWARLKRGWNEEDAIFKSVKEVL